MAVIFLEEFNGELLQNMANTGYSDSYRWLFELVISNIIENVKPNG